VVLVPASTIALTPGLGMADVPVVVTSHGTSIDEARSHRPRQFTDYLLKYGVHPANAVLDAVAGRMADHVIAISDRAYDRLTGVYGFDEDKVTMVPPGVDTNRFAPREEVHPAVDPDRHTVLTVGRLGSRKGVGLAVESFAQLDLDAELLVVGTGRREEHLRDLAAECGVEDSVRFLGHVPDEELPTLHSSVDVFILTSRYEGFGLVLLEAMACETPVIGADVGGVSTVVGPGHTVQRDSTEFALRLNDIQLCKSNTLQHNPRGRAKHLDWEEIIEDIEALYHRLVKPR